jgi:hypothetical protein
MELPMTQQHFRCIATTAGRFSSVIITIIDSDLLLGYCVWTRLDIEAMIRIYTEENNPQTKWFDVRHIIKRHTNEFVVGNITRLQKCPQLLSYFVTYLTMLSVTGLLSS